jgi:hypothetical protein
MPIADSTAYSRREAVKDAYSVCRVTILVSEAAQLPARCQPSQKGN